jgi:hypothetical protein
MSAAANIPAVLPFYATLPVNFAQVEEDGMPAIVLVLVDPKPKMFPEQRRATTRRRSVLANMLHHDGMMRFPEDEREGDEWWRRETSGRRVDWRFFILRGLGTQIRLLNANLTQTERRH